MALTTDPNDPDLKKPGADGQDKVYLVLSEEERAKGFVRPIRQHYQHVGLAPPSNLRDLTSEEHERYDKFGYVKYEEYPSDHSGSSIGRYWKQAELNAIGRCGTVTRMGLALAETYARDPKFYGVTFCSGCGRHYPVAEFVWDGTHERVGS